MCIVPVQEARMRRRPLSWLLSSAQNHSHTKTLSLSRSFWLQGRETTQTTLSPKWRTLIKTQGFLMQPKEGNAVEPYLEPERYQIPEQLLFLALPGPVLLGALSLLTVDGCFSLNYKDPLPGDRKLMCILFRPLLLWIFYHSQPNLVLYTRGH